MPFCENQAVDLPVQQGGGESGGEAAGDSLRAPGPSCVARLAQRFPGGGLFASEA
jgi:hypothetical protein